MTAPALSAWRAGVRAGASRRALRLVGALTLPAIVAASAVRYLIPSRLEGAGAGGISGALAWLGYHQPLFVGLALFVAISEAGRYWIRGRRDSRSQPLVSPPGGSGSRRRSARRLIVALAAVVALAFVIRASVVATFRVAGPSMLPTLEIGDRVLVNRLAYGLVLPYSRLRLGRRDPRRGELVVFRANGLTGADGPQSVVKRVIGLPGDEVAYQNGTLTINDWVVPTCDAGPYVDLTGRLTVRGRLTVEFLGADTYLTVRKPIERTFPAYTVAPGEVYVVGDDRGLSSDSRLWNEGRGAGVPSDILEGRVSRVLLGARPDGRLDFGRLLAPALDLKVRLPGFDLAKTEERIKSCLGRRPAVTWPPTPPGQRRGA